MIATASQTIGPFFREGLARPAWSDLTRNGAGGDAVRIDGVVLDGDGAPVPDALIEIWQPGADGTFDGETSFVGFGRACSDAEGRYWFRTVVPGPLAPGAAPFVAVSVFARGLLKRLVTRIYFPEHAAAHRRDPVLAALPDDAARATLVAVRTEAASGPAHYRFDIRLQGAGETVFFAL